MLLRLFEETKLIRANMLVLEKEIREIFKGKILYVWERGFDATSTIHENVFFAEEVVRRNSPDQPLFDNMGIKVEVKIGYDVLSLTFTEPPPLGTFTARFESGDDDPMAVWLGPSTLLIKNRRRPINAKVPIKELYITAVPIR